MTPLMLLRKVLNLSMAAVAAASFFEAAFSPTKGEFSAHYMLGVLATLAYIMWR